MTQHPDDNQPPTEPPVYGTPAPGGPAPAPPPAPGSGAPLFTPRANQGQSTPPPPLIWGQGPGGAAPPPTPPAPPRPTAPGTGPGAPPSAQEQRQWAMLAHLGGVLAIWPVIPLIPALAIFSIYLRKDEYIKDQAQEALNFQIVVLIAWIAARILDSLPFFPDLTILVWVFSLIFAVIGAVAAGRGQRFRYPLTYRFLT
jgi:uncharacterized Tic20 family protein